MNVVIQHLESRLYLTGNANWVKLNDGPRIFPDPLAAISFCIQRSLREIRLVGNPGCLGEEKHFYPFGQDPSVAAERRKLRKLVAENRRLKKQRQIVLAHIDLLQAESKEKKRQFPFRRKPLGQHDP